MDRATGNSDYIYSRLATDPDLRGIVTLFVEEMPERVAMIQEHLRAANWDGLLRTAHQLKGAAGSYGFDPISPCAGKVETAIRNSQPEDRIRELVTELANLCARARGGLPGSQA
jgi:histidine phosphotransfer protein HptB